MAIFTSILNDFDYVYFIFDDSWCIRAIFCSTLKHLTRCHQSQFFWTPKMPFGFSRLSTLLANLLREKNTQDVMYYNALNDHQNQFVEHFVWFSSTNICTPFLRLLVKSLHFCLHPNISIAYVARRYSMDIKSSFNVTSI